MEDIRGLAPNKVTKTIDDDILHNNKNSVSEVVDKLKRAEQKAKEQGYTDIQVDVQEESDYKNANIILKGTRFETIEEVAERRIRYLSQRYRNYMDYMSKEKVFTTDSWKSELEEMKALGFNMKNLGVE